MVAEEGRQLIALVDPGLEPGDLPIQGKVGRGGRQDHPGLLEPLAARAGPVVVAEPDAGAVPRGVVAELGEDAAQGAYRPTGASPRPVPPRPVPGLSMFS